MRYYSKSTGSTYLSGLHSRMPPDSVPISSRRYHEVIASPNSGKVRAHDAEGLPVLVNPPPPPAYIPAVVSRFQARAALHQSGRLAEVETAIAESDVITKMAWQDAQEFRRNSPTILALGDQLGLDLDALFIAAAQIQA